MSKTQNKNPLKTLSKDQLDWLWAQLTNLEEKVKRTPLESATIKELQHKLEINARKVNWNARGVRVINGGKQKVA